MNGFRLEEWIPQYTEFIDRSSHRRCSLKEGIQKNFASFTRKQLSQGLFLIKFINFIKNRLQHGVSIDKLLRKPNLKNICRRLLLYRHVFFLFALHISTNINPAPKSILQFSISLVSMENQQRRCSQLLKKPLNKKFLKVQRLIPV